MSFETPLPPYNASDPHAHFLNASCLDLLLIELVPMAERMTLELSESGAANGAASVSAPTSDPADGGSSGGNNNNNNKKAGGGAGEEDEQQAREEATYYRLDALGYRVGQGIVERFSRDRPRFTDNLDVIKFVCKDLWTILFRKQIDNLKTNHRGVYVLNDNSFRPFSRMSMAVRSEAVARAQAHLWFPCGVIRGGLASMGINATVQAETSELPGATFQIKTIPAK